MTRSLPHGLASFAILGMLVLLIIVPSGSAQDPEIPEVPSAPSQENVTGAREQFFAVQLEVEDDTAIEFGPIDTIGRVGFTLTDISEPAQVTQSGGVYIECTIKPLTPHTGYTGSFASSCPTLLPPGQSRDAIFQVSRILGSGPLSTSWRIDVNMTYPVEEPIGSIVVTTWATEFANLFLTQGVGGTVAPDTEFEVPVTLKNSGNYIGIYRGSVEAPPGWTVVLPEYVAVQPGEEVQVNLSVLSPRGKMVYISESGLITVRFQDTANPQITRSVPVSVMVNGVYVPPQLIPFVLLSMGLIAVFIFFGILARRALEEQILGKPVPPWRIPVERAYLDQLAKENPDDFYVVRYYLMEEEHQSALLWYNAYKKATKKDRKAESGWVKLKNKQERKIRSEEKAHARLEKKWDRKVLRMEKKRDRKIRRLEKKLRRTERKKQKRFDKKYDSIIAKIQKKHDKKVAKAVKKHEKRLAKETKQVERQNKKLEKNGDAPLPLPDHPLPEFAAPELPERKQAEEIPLEESRYAKRAERIRKYYDWRAERRRARGDRLIVKDARKRGIKMEKLRAKIPPEPKTHLYDTDEFLSEDEVIVEDDRPFVAKLLHMPTLEEREAERRRRNVYRARLKEAKASDDPRKAEAVMQAFAEEQEARKQARKEQLELSRASSLERKRLMKERQRQIKERAKEMAREAKAEAKDRSFKVGRKAPEGPAPDASQAPAPKSGPDADQEAQTDRVGGLRARFKKREGKAQAEEEKKERLESPEAAPSGSEDQN